LKYTDNNKNNMDTIIIKIYGPHKFQFRNKALFLPEINSRKYEDLSLTEIQSRNSSRAYLRKFILHPKASDEYIPKVEVFETLSKDSDTVLYVLKITFSAPKLLYWNSLQEVGEHDMPAIFTALQSALGRVGIVVEITTIATATVEAVHACKNVPLPKTMHMRNILSDLGRMDISKVNDVTETQFKHGGRVLNFYSGTIERSFYDKISDCIRPKNKRSDKGHIDPERATVEHYGLQSREVFRYEYRIKKTQTVKREVNTLLGREHQTPVTFKDLFAPNILKTMILNSWQALIERPENQLSLFSDIDTLNLLLHMLSEAAKQSKTANSMDKALMSYGLALAIRDNGAKELKGAIFGIWNKDHPERLTKKIKNASELMSRLPYSNSITFIDKALERYELISLASLQKGI
jgi:hypothetical protein